MASDARLIWGSTALISALTENDLRAASSPPAYIIQASADGTNFGNPQAVITEIRSHLQDGSLASVTSYDNREGSVTLMVSALTHDALGQAEAALVAETKVPGYSTLSWTPAVSLSVAPTVYDVVWSDLSWQMDDMNLIKRPNGVLRMFFTVKFELSPFGHDATPTIAVATTGAPPVTPTVTSIDAGTSAANWTGRYGSSTPVTPTTTGSSIVITTSLGAGGVLLLTRSGTVNMSGDTVLAVDYRGNALSTPKLVLSGGGAPVTGTLVQTVVLSSTNYNRSYFTVPGSTVFTSFAFSAYSGNTTTRLEIDQVSRQNAIPVMTTGREQARSAAIGGSARARATITVTADSTKTLGDLTMVYTRDSTTGFQPPLQPYATTVGSTNTALISGQFAAIGTAAKVYRVPARLLNEALHGLVARTQATTAGTYTLTYTAALKTVAGALLPESTQSITGSVSVVYPAANTWQTNEVGALQLPTVPVAPDSTHVMEITLQASNNVVQLDEAWLFDLDCGELSWLDTTGLTRLEIRPADVSNPEPSYWGGTVDGGAATGLVRADYRTVPAISASQSNGGSFAQHFIEPGNADIFTVTSGTEASSLTLTYKRSFLHNVSS